MRLIAYLVLAGFALFFKWRLRNYWSQPKEE